MSLFSREITGADDAVYCARYLNSHGYRNARVTKASRDMGVDDIARRRGKTYAVQCKYYSGKVGNYAVQEVFAGKSYYECDRAIVMTNSTFTPAAKALAENTDVILMENIHYRNLPFARTPLGRFVITCVLIFLCVGCLFSFTGTFPLEKALFLDGIITGSAAVFILIYNIAKSLLFRIRDSRPANTEPEEVSEEDSSL